MLQSLTSRRRQNLRFSSLDSGNSFHSPFTTDFMTEFQEITRMAAGSAVTVTITFAPAKSSGPGFGPAREHLSFDLI
jgi:hypothetical protein